jgi:signal recognition particle GTPase
MNKNLANNLKRSYKKRKTERFFEWLNKEVDDDLFNRDIITEFINEITDSLRKNGYEINNENIFKNEIAEYIYLESS